MMNPTIDKETTYNLLECETFNPLYPCSQVYGSFIP